MGLDEKFTSIRKGLLEFVILKIVSADKVYVADMLDRLSKTEFATQEGTLYPLLSKMRRDGLVDYEWQESEAGPPAQVLHAHRQGSDAARRARTTTGKRSTPRSASSDVDTAMHKVTSSIRLLNGNCLPSSI